MGSDEKRPGGDDLVRHMDEVAAELGDRTERRQEAPMIIDLADLPP